MRIVDPSLERENIILHMKTQLCTFAESETTSASNWKVMIRDSESGRRGVC